MLQRVRLWSEGHQVIRPITICAIAIAITAYAVGLKGWSAASISLGGIFGLLVCLMVFQVWWAVNRLHQQSDVVHKSAIAAEQHYIDVLRRIMRYVEGRERHTGRHSERIGDLAKRIARKLSLPAGKCEMLHIAGELHDIGLLAVPENILNKDAGLGREEFHTVQKHAEISYEILKPLKSLQDMLPAVRYHHERANGTGYPYGISGDDIPVEARILAVADAYDAMTHDRPHRCAITAAEALGELRRCTPHGYDARCVEALASVLNLSLPDKVSVTTK